MRVYHGGPEQITSPRATIDPEGLPEGFSVARTPDIAQAYANMRGNNGGVVSEFEINPDQLRTISEMDYYNFLDDLEMRVGVDREDLADAEIRNALLDEGYNAIWYPDEDFGIRILDPSILRPVSQTPAQRVAGLLSSGRADEVTDEMMAAADPQEMARLYASGATGMDLPMDEASRMARAQEMGFTDDAYHATGADFQQFIPSEFRGASFFGSTAEGASKGASASANEGVGSGSGITMPVRVNTSGVEGLGRYARRDMNEFRASLPDRVYTEAEVDALMASDAAPLRGNWDDFFTDLTDYDALRDFRRQNPDEPIPEGIIAFRPKQPLSYGPHLNSTQALNLSGRQFPHYSEGMSERPTSEYVKSQGNTGFTMLDESGLALAMVDPTRIRSRFARFDPRLSHLSNLNAANASPLLGGAVLAAPQEQPDPLRNLRGLLAR